MAQPELMKQFMVNCSEEAPSPAIQRQPEITMADATTNVFVYGTLKPGAWNHRLIEPYVHHTVPARTRGILVALGSIPALIPGDGLVRGIMLTVDHAAIARMDRLEGVPHFYRRKETSVTLDDGSEVTAWVYEYSEPSRLANHPRLLVHSEGAVPVYVWAPSK